MPVVPFSIVTPEEPRAPLIAHVPHVSTVVPPRIRRENVVLVEPDLQRELVRLTDWHADHLLSWVAELGGCMFVGTLSRLVMDPERFVDDEAEPMAAVGQGVVYTHSTLLPSEPDQDPERPDICIGTDPLHTPPELTAGLVSAFRKERLTVQVDRPFSGTLVPLRFLGVDDRVRFVMIEVRRGLYCDEATGERSMDFDDIRAAARADRRRGGGGGIRTREGFDALPVFKTGAISQALPPLRVVRRV